MTRCCSAWTNVCPEPAPVSIEYNTYNIDGDDIGFETERFVFATGPGNPFTAVTAGDGSPASATYYVTLSETPVNAKTVEARMGGTVPQRPLINAVGEALEAGEDPNFVAVGSNVYFFFDLVDGDEVYVKYISTP